jgi:uncharacterized membrane protein YedE/YeeE
MSKTIFQDDDASMSQRKSPQWAIAGAGFCLLLALGAASSLYVAEVPGGGMRAALLTLISATLGLSLYHGAFGFTAGWRSAIVRRDTRMVRAQVLMIAVAALLFAPALAQNYVFGQAVGGALAPVDVGVVAGAFLFGLGMQLAGGCGSGTLFTVGGGSVRMGVTLIAFCAGGFIATLHFAFWRALPGVGEISMAAIAGPGLGLVATLGLLTLVWMALWYFGARTDQGLVDQGRPDQGRGPSYFWQGPWPLLWVAVALGVLNFASLITAGHPWSITWGFTLWAAKLMAALGWDPATSAFWAAGFPARALAAPVLADTTSLMNLAIILGALMAAGFAGRWQPGWKIEPGSLLAAVIGGLLLGYGARLAYGCNIGALFSGIASGSLHGWLWLAAALPGAVLGVRLRPVFGLSN